MKTIFTLLLALACLSAKAQVNYVATTNALALRVPSPNNPVVIVAPADGSEWKLWRYSPSSTSTDWDNALVTTTGTGRWLNVPLTDPVLTSGGGGSGTVTSITLTEPAAGLTISSSGTAITTSGTRTFALANDLAALEALSGTGYPSRTGTDTWSISTTVPWSAISSTPTTLAGYGLTVEGTDIKSTGEVGGSKFLREDGDGTSSWQAIPGGGDALTSSNLDQFANVTQTGTLAITGPATLSGSNTGDQDLSSYATTSAVAAGYQPLDADLTELADNQGIIRTNGIWWGTMTGENIISDLITTAAGILPYTGETEPDNYFAPIIFVKNLSPAIADTVTDLLAVDIMGIPRWGYVLTGTYTGTWVYCPDVTDADNGTTIRRPDEIASDATPGRWEYMGPATGDVVGPASSTDNAIAVFDGTTGKLLQNSVVTIDPATGDASGFGDFSVANLIVTNAIPVTSGGTGLTGGTSGGVPYYSSSSAITSSSALAANALVVGGGAGAAPSTVTTGTGILTALGVNTGSAGAPVLFNGAMGTPTSGTVDVANVVLRQNKSLFLMRPDYGDGAGAVPQTNSYVASGLMHYTFSGSDETNANYVVYETIVPTDIDTSVAMTATFAFVSGGTDADDVTFHITYALGASGTVLPTGTSIATSPIAITKTPTTPASGDVQVSAATTLTSWAGSMTAGTPLLIRIARLNTSNDDTARDMSLLISYGSTQ